MGDKNQLNIAISMAIGVLLLLGLFLFLHGSSKTALANPGNLFVTVNGSGTACTPAQPCSIQAALAKAIEGDTIYLAAGNYTGSGVAVVTIAKSIVLSGGWDGAGSGPIVTDPVANPTTLDGENARRVVSLSANITPTLEGLRITNGSATGDGGGILANGAHPIIRRCQIFNNTASSSGGAVYLNNSPNAWLSGNSIYDNQATTFFGGGVYLRNATDAILENNKVHHNIAGGEGGGVFVDNSDDILVQSNTIYTNTSSKFGGGVFVGGSAGARIAYNRVFDNAADQGGGIYVNNSSQVTLDRNLVHSNVTERSGGGVSLFVQNDNATLTRNTIYNNTAGGDGGGILIYESANPTLVNNIVTDNKLTGIGRGGAGIYAYDVEAILKHTTLARNSGGNGQGVYLQNGATLSMTNTILVSHAVGIEAGAGTTATLTATLWGDGAWANTDDTTGSGTILTGTLNLTGNPDFVNPTGGDYHIGLDSAARNAGVDAGIDVDVDGESRPAENLHDIGADEFWWKVFLPLELRQ